MTPSQNKKIILICSDGGHLAQILELADWFRQYDYLLVTEDTQTTRPLAEQYNMRFLRGRSHGNKRTIGFYFTLLANLWLSAKILFDHFPKAIITTGSHTAVPMCYAGKLFGAKIIWILSYARVASRAFSADVVYPISDRFIVQWPSARKLYKKSIYLGGGIY